MKRSLEAPSAAAERSAKSGDRLKARAIALLARREYSRAELREKLAAGRERHDAANAEIHALLEELASLGYLSDARYAEAFVRQKSGTLSKRAMAATLKAKGVTGDAAGDALASIEIDDEAALIALWRRRFGRAPIDEKDKARQARFLQARGFSLSAVLKLLRDPPDDGEDAPGQ